MSTLEDIKKAFPNMFRPLKWHHFDGPTEHGCGEWYAHATRGMYQIYDVREKFPNDRPFYAKELSDQFDTLEQAKDAVQNRHELDIVMCLDPDFRSTLESLQRENEEKSAWIKAATTEITKAIGGGSEMFTKHGDDFRVDPVFVATFIQFRRERHAESKKASIQKERELIARAEVAETEVKRLTQERYDLAYAITGGEDAPGLLDSTPTSEIVEIARHAHRSHSADIDRAEAAEAEVARLNAILEPFRAVSKDWVDENGWTDVACQKDRIVDWFGPSDFRALASTGGEHHGN